MTGASEVHHLLDGRRTGTSPSISTQHARSRAFRRSHRKFRDRTLCHIPERPKYSLSTSNLESFGEQLEFSADEPASLGIEDSSHNTRREPVVR